MPGTWDTSIKRLVGEHPEHFIQWLLPGAKFKGGSICYAMLFEAPGLTRRLCRKGSKRGVKKNVGKG